MFRRKDEEENSTPSNTTSSSSAAAQDSKADAAAVLTPQQAAAYNAQHNTTAGAATPAVAPSTQPSSYSAANAAAAGTARTTADSAAAARPAAAPFRANATAPEVQRPRAADAKSIAGNNAGSVKETRRILTVGTEILLKGEISTCDRLVIEGKVDATVTDVHTVELAEAGSFKGVAQVEFAEISGLFEGELNVKNRLIVYSTGKVRGKITYGEIEIERGGEISGEISTFSETTTQQTYNRRERVAA